MPEVAKILASAEVGNSQKRDKIIGLDKAFMVGLGGRLNFSRKDCIPGQKVNTTPEKRGLICGGN